MENVNWKQQKKISSFLHRSTSKHHHSIVFNFPVSCDELSKRSQVQAPAVYVPTRQKHFSSFGVTWELIIHDDRPSDEKKSDTGSDRPCN